MPSYTKIILIVICLLILTACWNFDDSMRQFGYGSNARINFARDETNGIAYTDVRWSNDNTVILGSASIKVGKGLIYIADPNTGRVNAVESNGNLINGAKPVPSPSGKFIAFLNRDTGKIEVMGNSQPFTIQMSLPYLGYAAWSPNEKQLAIITQDSYTVTIKIVDLQQKNAIKIFERFDHRILSDGDISWSPDGKQIAFSIGWQSSFKNLLQFDLYTLAIDSKQLVQVTDSDLDSDSSPSWSSDSSTLLFVSTPVKLPTMGQVNIIDINDRCFRSLSEPIGVQQVALSPDGNKVAIVTSSGEAYVVPIADLDVTRKADVLACP